MRITLVNPYLPPPVGGIEREIINLFRCLEAMGHEPTVVASSAKFPRGRHAAGDYDAFLEGRRALVLPGYIRSTLRGFQPSRAPFVMPGLLKAVGSTDPAAVFFFNIGWPLTARRAVIRLRRRVPVVLRTYYHPPGGRLARVKDRLLFRFVGAFDAALCATEQEKAQIASRGFTRHEKLKIIPPGVLYCEVPGDEKRRFRREHGLDDRLLISHVGRLSEFKGTGRLLRALPALRRLAPRPLTLVLIGRCDDRDWLHRTIKENTEQPREVLLTGEILDETVLRRIVAATDIFALPSDYESFGFVFLEAMAAGVPVLAPRTGGVSGLVEHGRQGFLLDDPANLGELTRTLGILMNDPELRSTMARSGVATARDRFSWEKTTRAYLDLVATIVKERAGM